MHNKPPAHHILKITGPGGAAWGSKYVEEIVRTFAQSDTAVFRAGDGTSGISLDSIRNESRAFAFTRNQKMVLMTFHGTRDESGTHLVEIAKGELSYTSAIFRIINEWVSSPIYLFLASCYGGACEADLTYLPPGSIMFTTASKDGKGYGADGKFIAEALNHFLSDGTPIELAMYLMAYSYLAHHKSFLGNHPTLIIRGYGEIIQKPFTSFEKVRIESPLRTQTLIEALLNSPYSVLLNKAKELLETPSGTPRASLVNKLPLMNRIAAHTTGASLAQFTIDNKLESILTSALQNSSLLFWFTQNQEQMIAQARTHNIKNKSLLRLAIRLGKFDFAIYLIKQGVSFADLKINDFPIIFFATDNVGLLEALIERGVNFNVAAPETGDTPLHRANLECSRILLANGANPNQVNNDGYTVVHSTIAQNDVEKFALLYIQRNTDKSITTPSGQGYFNYAESLGRQDIMTKMREQAPTPSQPKRKFDDEGDALRKKLMIKLGPFKSQSPSRGN